MAVVHNYLPGDPLLIDKIVYELKSQGIFDQFRKECIADVDTKPAYQNLRQRVEGSVSGFLNKQRWSPEMNKNHVREMLRKNIYESGFLETGVERIVDQVVNPKINSVFLPKVTEVVYKFLGIEQSTSDKRDQLPVSLNNDLPTDLEAVSPESDKKFDVSNDSQTLDDSKIDEDESPPFEPLEEKPICLPHEENSMDSHLSGFSGLMSHDSNHSQERPKPHLMEISNQDSALSKQSSEGRLSIVMSDDNETKMDISYDTKGERPKDFTFSLEILSKRSESRTDESSDNTMFKRADEKSQNGKHEKNEKSGKSHDKHKSRHDKDRKSDDKDKKSDRDRKDYKHSSKDKGKDHKDSKSENGSRSDSKNDKYKHYDSKSDKNKHKSRHTSSSSKDKEKSSSRKDSSSSRDRNENKDKTKCSSSSKDFKHKDDRSKGDSQKHESRVDRHRKDDKHRSDKHSSSSKSRDKEKRDSKKDKKENKDDHFSAKKKPERRSTDRDSNDGHSYLKSSSSSFDSSISSHTQSKTRESSNSNSNNGSRDSGASDAMEVNGTHTVSAMSKEMNLQERNVAIHPLKLIKPKFASNIHEARRLMKIRKQLKLLEKQNYLHVPQRIDDHNEDDKKQTSDLIKPVKEVTPPPPSPPLKSATVSAATWDALEAKLHESINYSTSYYDPDYSQESIEESVVKHKDDCLYLSCNLNEKEERYKLFVNDYIEKLENSIKEGFKKKSNNNHINKVNKGVKRKFMDCHSDLRNNNKRFNTHHIEVHDSFSLPLSPAESDNSVDKKSDASDSSEKLGKKTDTEFVDRFRRTIRGSMNSQRYSSEDLYKPRPMFGGSRRRNGRNVGLD